MISANAANEDENVGKTEITPYWRTLKKGGQLNPKYPGGIDNIKKRLASEGHSIIQKRKKFVVKDFEKSIVDE